MKKKSPMRFVIAGLVILLLAIHQDFWNWENTTLVFGFLPIALFYHACISVAAAATWFLATKVAWPVDDEPMTPATSEKGGEK